MKRIDIETETYEVRKNWYVDIITHESKYEAYIFHKDYGIKNHMISTKRDIAYMEFLTLVEKNIKAAIELYKAENNIKEK